jgi:D-alanine-D-alanine ligase
MNVLVLLGGNSPERDVSIRSGKAVVSALQSAGHNVIEYDPVDDFRSLESYKDKIDCVFPILHGIGGEDGSVQSLLEEHGFKYLGSDAETSKICFDKALFKKELEKLGIDTPKWQIVNAESIKEAPTDKPFVLKPISNGSAIDTYIIRNPAKKSFPMDVFERYEEMLFEELIEGDEITVGILEKKPYPL